MRPKDSNLATFVNALQRKARYSFTRAEAAAAVTVSSATLTKGLQRLQNAGRIHRIRKGFYTIVPLEHADAGHIPTDWFIADLMRFLDPILRRRFDGCRLPRRRAPTATGIPGGD